MNNQSISWTTVFGFFFSWKLTNSFLRDLSYHLSFLFIHLLGNPIPKCLNRSHPLCLKIFLNKISYEDLKILRTWFHFRTIESEPLRMQPQSLFFQAPWVLNEQQEPRTIGCGYWFSHGSPSYICELFQDHQHQSCPWNTLFQHMGQVGIQVTE